MSSDEETEEPIVLDIQSIRTNQPNIGLQSDYFHYELASTDNPENFRDRFSFNSPPVVHEASLMAKLQTCIEEARECINILYTYRSVDKALPKTKPNTADDSDYNIKVYRILDPQIKNMEKIMNFIQSRAVPLLKKTFIALEKFEETFGQIISDSLFHFVIRLLDIILKLNALKSMRDDMFLADFTRYKRAVMAMNKDEFEGEELEEIENFCSAPVQPVHLFLIDKKFVLEQVGEILSKTERSWKWLIIIVNHCVHQYYDDYYLHAEEKHCLLRVMVFGIYLCDGFKPTKEKKKKSEDEEDEEIAKKKQDLEKEIAKVMKTLDTSRMYKVFKNYPYIPLMNDMTYQISQDLERCENLDRNCWQLSKKEEQNLESNFLLTKQVDTIREEFLRVTTEYQLMINKIQNIKENDGEISNKMKKKVTDVVIRAMQHVAKWKTQLCEQCAWKYKHGATLQQLEKIQEIQDRLKEAREDPKNEKLDIDDFITAYEKDVRYNYTKLERTILVDVISMIKGLANLMLRHTHLLSPIIRAQVYKEVQLISQKYLTEFIQKCQKKRPELFEKLTNLRAFTVDLDDAEEIDLSKRGIFKKKTAEVKLILKPRITPGSATQHYMLRSIISTLYSNRSEGMTKKGLFSSKDFKKEQVKIMDAFYRRSYFWNPLLNFSSTVKRASDLSFLWHREFYLQLESKIQMPIDNSLPWMLVKNIISKRNLELMDSVFYPLSIYDDAADLSLFELKAKHLYEEIEAEVNLVFDQFVYKLSESIYSYYKIKASILVLGNKSSKKYDIPPSRFLELLRQRSFSLLGRRIDLNRILSKSINHLIVQNVGQCIKRFTTGSITRIGELNSLLEVVKYTHQLLSAVLDLDNFDSIMSYCDETTCIATFGGKITNHIANELIFDIFQNYIYNENTQRFVKSPVEVSQDENPYSRGKPFRITGYYSFGSKELAQNFGKMHQILYDYFGNQHIQLLIRILGENSLSLLCKTIIIWMQNLIYTDIAPYVKALRGGIPPNAKLDTMFGLEGCVYKYQKQFDDITKYPDMVAGVYHSFRVIGNGLAFLLLLDNNLSQSNLKKYMNAAPFINLKPQKGGRSAEDKKRFGKSGVKVEKLNVTPLDKIDDTPLVSIVQGFLESEKVKKQIHIDEKVIQDIIFRSRNAVKELHPLNPNLSLFSFALAQMHYLLRDEYMKPWNGLKGKESLKTIEGTKSFSKLWSIFQFSFNWVDIKKTKSKQAPTEEEYTNYDIFGDAFNWAGSAMVYLFGQYERFLSFNFMSHSLDMAKREDSKMRRKHKKFLDSCRRVKKSNLMLYDIFRKYYPLEKDEEILVTEKDVGDEDGIDNGILNEYNPAVSKRAPKKGHVAKQKKTVKEESEEESEEEPKEEEEELEEESAKVSDKERKRQEKDRKKKEKAAEKARKAKEKEEAKRRKKESKRSKRKVKEEEPEDDDDDGPPGPPPPPGLDDLKISQGKAGDRGALFAQINALRDKGSSVLKKVDESEIKRPKSPKSLEKEKNSGGGRGGMMGGGGGNPMMMAIQARARGRMNQSRGGSRSPRSPTGRSSPKIPPRKTGPPAPPSRRRGGRSGGSSKGRPPLPRKKVAKKVDDDDGPPGPPPPPGLDDLKISQGKAGDRGALFAQINALRDKGTSMLKKVDKNEIKRPKSPKTQQKEMEQKVSGGGGGGGGMAAQIAAMARRRQQRNQGNSVLSALSRRRNAMQGKDSDDEDSDDED